MSKFPSTDDLLAWIAAHPRQATRRDIAKAFGLKGADRTELKRLLRALKAEGRIAPKPAEEEASDALPPVAVLEVTGSDEMGELHARPVKWAGDDATMPDILVISRASDPALGQGDRFLGRLTEVEGQPHRYEARLIRRIANAPRRIVGIFRAGAEGGRIAPIDKAQHTEWAVRQGEAKGAQDGELVEAEQIGRGGRLGLPRARVVSRLGDPSGAAGASLIAIHQHGIPNAFAEEVLAEAEDAAPLAQIPREDFRHLPLVTIDPADARDHDDACYAHADSAADNPGGHVIWVAIADVAAYVRPGSALDRAARARGNSTYFPDRVVPMLPERLSADLCSLHEGAERPAIAVRIRISAEGEKLDHRFHRITMQSPAALHYEEVQSAIDGAPNPRTASLLSPVLRPLYAAYGALLRARARRQPLALDLPERQISLGADGQVRAIAFKDRLDAHRLVEEFMVLANVCAAQTLLDKPMPLLLRVHEEPGMEKLDALRDTARACGLTLAKGQVLQTRHLNHLLAEAAKTEDAELINLATLRAMTQAYYSPENFGHFGLALAKYAHFTSPIRRYADLIVHRALIAAHGWGGDGLSPADTERLEKTASHISDTERRSMRAERDTADRYIAAYLSDRLGTELPGRISGVARFGAFVTLDETGADGLIPIRRLGREYFDHDSRAETLTGTETGQVIARGARVSVRLVEASAASGGLEFDLLTIDGAARKHNAPGGAGKGPRRKPAQHRKRISKIQRKVRRSR